MSTSILAPTNDFPAGNPEGSGDGNYRYLGQPLDGEKSAQSGQRARREAFATLEEFAAWRRSKGMPELSHWNLIWAWARFKGEPTTEQAVLNPVSERR